MDTFKTGLHRTGQDRTVEHTKLDLQTGPNRIKTRPDWIRLEIRIVSDVKHENLHIL